MYKPKVTSYCFCSFFMNSALQNGADGETLGNGEINGETLSNGEILINGKTLVNGGQTTQHVRFEIKNLVEDAFKLITLITDWLPNEIELSVCTHGITNKLVHLKHRTDDLLVRVYGNNTEILIDRSQELENINILHKHSLAPKLYCKFDNGIVYGYVKGSVFTVPDMSKHWNLVASTMSKWHQIKPTAPCKPSLFPTLLKWVDAGNG